MQPNGRCQFSGVRFQASQLNFLHSPPAVFSGFPLPRPQHLRRFFCRFSKFSIPPDDWTRMTQLARKLRVTDYFSLGWGTMVGVGWLVVMDDWLLRGGSL